jgi:hypothetical protein
MSTVGFGDVVPVSHVGRIITIASSIWGTFIFTLVIVAFSIFFNLNPVQKKAMHHLLVTRKAANTIVTAWRYYKAKRERKALSPSVHVSSSIHELVLERSISLS